MSEVACLCGIGVMLFFLIKTLLPYLTPVSAMGRM